MKGGDYLVRSWSQWIINMLLGLDQLGNTILGGEPDETISSRLGRLKVSCGGKIPWSKYPLARLVYEFLEFIDEGHCISAIEKQFVIKEDEKNAEKE